MKTCKRSVGRMDAIWVIWAWYSVLVVETCCASPAKKQSCEKLCFPISIKRIVIVSVAYLLRIGLRAKRKTSSSWKQENTGKKEKAKRKRMKKWNLGRQIAGLSGCQFSSRFNSANASVLKTNMISLVEILRHVHTLPLVKEAKDHMNIVCRGISLGRGRKIEWTDGLWQFMQKRSQWRKPSDTH